MKRLHTHLALLTVAFALLFSACRKEDAIEEMTQASTTSQRIDIGSMGSEVTCVDLLAGQTTDAGDVCINDVDTDNDDEFDAIEIEISTSGGWQLTAIHAWVGSSLSGMPRTRSGNPIPGQFPYKTSHNGDTTHSIVISYETLGYTCGDTTNYLVAVHADVRKLRGNGNNYQNEGAWADGSRITNRGNWATYFNFHLSCEEEEVEILPCSEPAFAHLSSSASCFTNISGISTSQWGWSNGGFGNGTYTMNLVADADQCDPSYGIVCGTVTVAYSGSSATVTYQVNSGYILEEVFLYVGNTILPYAENSTNFTIDPYQYGNNPVLNAGSTSYSSTYTNLNGDIYVVAHAVVKGFECIINY